MICILVAVFVALDVLLLAASILCIVASTAWRNPDTLTSLVFMPRHIDAALTLGLLLATTFLLSIPALSSPIGKPKFLQFLSAALVLDTLFAIGAGTCVWLYSLRQRQGYAGRWEGFGQDWRLVLEEKWQCCGYWNATEAGLFIPPLPDTNWTTTPFCSGTDTTLEERRPPGCMDDMLLYTDMTLENTFSSIYGVVCITLALFLTTACIINERRRILRFRKIDQKRGGSGFV